MRAPHSTLVAVVQSPPPSSRARLCPRCGGKRRNGGSRVTYCSNACAYAAADEALRADVERHLGEPLEPWLRRRYIDEQATFRELQIEMGLADNARRLKRWLLGCGIEPRGKSEAVRLQHRRDPSRGERWAGWLATDEAQRRTAKSRQANPNPSTLQRAAVALAEELGLRPIVEFAFDRYNIDIALPDQMVAIEINGGNWHTQERDAPRDGALIAAGWTVHRFQDRDFGRLLRLLESL